MNIGDRLKDTWHRFGSPRGRERSLFTGLIYPMIEYFRRDMGEILPKKEPDPCTEDTSTLLLLEGSGDETLIKQFWDHVAIPLVNIFRNDLKMLAERRRQRKQRKEDV